MNERTRTPKRTVAELLAERRARGLTAADLPASPGIYAERFNSEPAVSGRKDER